MNFSAATLPQLYVIAFYDEMATPDDRQRAADEIVRRESKKRKPYRNNQQKIRRAYPKW
ncbi:hypothetical protein COLU111180_12165 [Cohnella lubricantis]|uniref:Uncharacterized protein n=1 Tax=Cohnella lubricantis TaxID=2163172 RepID=A0A841T7K3_9BACL|nr:hypothetical protein [Cohnella lubricantis]MBB6675945.1 hypothetical protein [Cohnella lubricantis]MBP2117938.1 hypothetical protein [Cohnella lubricantis]